MNPVEVRSTPIPGLLLITSAVHHDERGWFSQAWSAADLARVDGVPAGLADFHPVQHNLSFNVTAGTTRGRALRCRTTTVTCARDGCVQVRV